MKKLLLSILFIGMALSLLYAGGTEEQGAGSSGAAAEPTKLTAVSFVPKGNIRTEHLSMLIDKINENAGGMLSIELLGGPEVIGMFEQAAAVKQGVVDIALQVPSFYDSLAPGTAMLDMSRIPPSEERARGIWKLVDDLHQKNGLKFLGRGSGGSTLLITRIWLTNSISKPQEMKGKRIMGGVYFNPILKAFGAGQVEMPLNDVYTGLERNVIDGVANPLHQVVGFAWNEHIKYAIEEPLLGISSVTLIMNLSKWNSLSSEQKRIIEDTIIEMEPVIAKAFDAANEEMWDKVKAQGMQLITFSPEDTRWYVETAHEAKWNDLLATYPEVGPKLKDLLTRE